MSSRRAGAQCFLRLLRSRRGPSSPPDPRSLETVSPLQQQGEGRWRGGDGEEEGGRERTNGIRGKEKGTLFDE